MKRLQQNKIRWNYLALAFILPVVCMLIFMLIRRSAPFGHYSMLYSDQYHQYYPFFLAYRRALLSGQSLLYNWDIGMGMDYLGLLSYYLASPLNLVSVLVPENWMLGFFSLLVPVRMGLASLFFAIFLRKEFDKNDWSIVLFGCFYGFCAWSLGYQWNVMWMDTFALLPLVMLGMVSLLEKRKFVLYTTALFLAVFANYYVGLFVCVFTLLAFICYEICRWQGIKKFSIDFFCMALFSILAIGMTAILELPTLAALQTTYSSVNEFPKEFRLNIVKEHNFRGLLDAMRQIAGNMNGGLTPSFKEGLPNLYCGVVCNIFAFLFLTCREIKLRDKLCSIALLLFFSLSFAIRQLDYIWHGFHFPNMIPYRFSFLYSFVVLYMAYRAYLHRESFRLWQILLAIIPSVGLLLCVNDFTDVAYWAYNCLFLLLYFAIFIYSAYQKRLPENAEEAEKITNDHTARKQIASSLLLLVMAVEIIMNLINFGVCFPRTNIANYPRGTSSTAAALQYMKEREADNLFYRTETTHSQTLNDGALNNYHGISAFTSSANVKVTTFMKALGYGAKNSFNRYCFEESSPVSNLFLNLKYMVERDGNIAENAYFDDVYESRNVHLLENNAYLPLGFLANSQLADLSFDSKLSSLIFQNELLTQATGINEDFWDLIPVEITSKDVPLKSTGTTGFASYETVNSGGYIIYNYTPQQAGFMCIDLNLPKKNAITVSINGMGLYSETYSIPQTLAVCDVAPGDLIEVRITCKKEEKGTIRIHAGILNEALFRQAYEVLASSTLQLTKFENTRIEGTIDCNRDGLLYTSIPQNGNWYATVDGQPAEITLVGDAMVGVMLTGGEHTVVFTYQNKAFDLGWKISLASLVIFLALYLLIYKPIKKTYNGKY